MMERKDSQRLFSRAVLSDLEEPVSLNVGRRRSASVGNRDVLVLPGPRISSERKRRGRSSAEEGECVEEERVVPIARYPVLEGTREPGRLRRLLHGISFGGRGASVYCGSDPRRVVVINEPEADKGMVYDIADDADGPRLFMEMKRHMEAFLEASNRFDLVGLRRNGALLEFEAHACKLCRFDLSLLGPESRRTLFINLYNCLAIHARLYLTRVEPVSKRGGSRRFSLRASLGRIRERTLDCCAYNVGGYIFTLDDMLHGILRGNRAPTSPSLGPPPGSRPWLPFFDNDRRHQFSVPLDPRIHFMLDGRGSNGSLSLQSVRFLHTREVDSAMQHAIHAFLLQDKNFAVNVARGTITISNLFLVYKDDFGGDVVGFVATNLSPYYEKRKDLDRVKERGPRLRFIRHFS